MVVSLSDLRAGKTSDSSESSGVVRLSDIRGQATAKRFIQDEKTFGAPKLNPTFDQANQQIQEAAKQPQPVRESLADKAQSFNQPDANGNLRTDYPLGILNPLNDINRIQNAPLVRTLEHSAGQGMGLQERDMTPSKSTGSKLVDTVANILGQGTGYLTNPAQIEQNVGQTFFNNPLVQKAADKVESAIGSRIPQTVAGKAITNIAKQGTSVGLGSAMYAHTQTLNSGGDLKDIPKNMLEQGLQGAALGGLGGAFGSLAKSGLSALGQKYAGSKLGSAVSSFLGRSKAVAPEAEQTTKQTLSSYSKPLTNPQPLDSVMQDIHQEVSQRITPPLENPKLLDKYLAQHLGEDVPKSEISALSYNEKADLAKHIQDNLSVHDVATQVAKEKGYDWNALSDQSDSVKPNVEQPKKYNVGDTAIPTTADGADLSEPKKIVDVQSKDGINYYRFDGENTFMPENMVRNEGKLSDTNPVTESKVIRLADIRKTNVEPDVKVKGQQLKDLKTGDEVKFAKTVQDSEHTPPELLKSLKEKPITGARTSDILNHQEATKLIEKHGAEGLYAKLMGKTKQFDSYETTAAEILSKHFASKGGDESLTKSLDLLAKTGKGGREMGQAIQALSMWNKMDQAGAMLLATREVNKGVDIKDYKSLTIAQATPIKEAAQLHETAVQTKSLADEVLNIVTNKPEGEKLTEAEKAKIKEFNDQVKSIQDKTKSFLPKEKVVSKSDATIKEVSQIEPKARTRDQVVSFLDAKAAKARERLALSRNKLSSTPFDQYADYAIIGASHIAKGVVKLSDFTEQMVKDFGTAIKPQISELYTKANNIFRKENGLPTIEALDKVVNKAVKDERFTPEDAANFKAWAAEIGHYADHNLKTEAVQDLQAAMKDLGDSTLGQKIATTQTGAMLLNPVTMERNVLGNAAQMIGDKVSKIVTVPIDWSVSKLTVGQRTIVFKSMNQEKFWKNFMIGAKSGWRGVSPNGQLDSYGIHPNVFGKNNPLKYITKSLGASLQGFDHAFYSSAKGEVLATYAEQLGKAQGLAHAEIKAGMKDLIVQLDDRIHELADHAGRYATYQDETQLSKGAEMLRHGLNEASTGYISRALVEKGMPKKLSMEGFGAGDVLVKFAKTPANLVMRGMDYSPIGFIRSTMDLGAFVFNRGKFNQHEAVRALGRAITGTLGFTGMGYILSDAGILTGSASMDKDVRSIQEQSGQGAYKVNWSALSRFMRSGFNYDAAAYQKGDHLMDYQWLQPAAISVAMGVNANKAVKAHQAGDQTAGWQMAGKALLGGLQTVLENPMVQGLSNVIDAGSDIVKKQDPTKLINIAKGVPASFVPTLSNQARQSTDNYQRETFDKSVITEIGNMMANKVPGLSQKLPISYDSLGNAREKLQGGQANTVGQYLNSFFSPAKMTQYQVSPEAKITLDLMNQSGDASLLPRIENKYFHVSQGKQLKDLKVNLTKEEFSQLQQETGKLVTEKLSQQATYLANPNVSLQKKVDAVKQILTDAGKRAKQDAGQQMGYQKGKIKS